MEFKDYQLKVLDYLDSYLDELKTQKAEKQDYFEFQKHKGKDAVPPEKSDYCQLAWESLKAKKAVYRSNYTVRHDGMGRNIPNICFKVPTGGGKTLLAAAAIQLSTKIISSATMALCCGLCQARPSIPKPSIPKPANSYAIRSILTAKCWTGQAVAGR